MGDAGLKSAEVGTTPDGIVSLVQPSPAGSKPIYDRLPRFGPNVSLDNYRLERGHRLERGQDETCNHALYFVKDGRAYYDFGEAILAEMKA